MSDEKDPPIEAPGFIGGVTVVDIGDLRVARGLSRRAYSACRHPKMFYDQKERRIWCPDCERDVEAFDAFLMLVERYDGAVKRVTARETAVTEAEKFKIRSIAAQKIDQAWRHRDMVPACPHCGNGLFPEDFKRETAMLNKEYAQALVRRRERQ